MFDNAVVSEGLGQAAVAENRAQVRGTSPDGLGAYVQAEPGDPGYPYPRPTASSPNPPPVRYAQPQEQLEGAQWDFLEPDTTSGGAAARSAGFTLLFVAVLTGVGYALKGGLGASAGLLLGAGAANAYRAQKWWDTADASEKHEAMVSTVFAVAEIGAGGYVAYKAFQSEGRKGKSRE